MTEYFYLEPVDVFCLRGNKLFGGPGDHGESLMPPWPSIAAGALRTHILGQHGGISFQAYRKGEVPHGAAGDVLGVPGRPGSFRITCFTLGLRLNNRVDPVFSIPADLVCTGPGKSLNPRHPKKLDEKLVSSFPLELVPVAVAGSPEKEEPGFWMHKEGMARYMRGQEIQGVHLIHSSEMWNSQTRPGIALDPGARSAEKGRIYTTENISLKKDVGFLVGVEGAAGLVPSSGTLRFGGDGRGAVLQACDGRLPEPDWGVIAETRRFKLILTTPGIFPQGWLPPGTETTARPLRWRYGSVRAKLVSACVKGFTVVSGWDLVTRRPKTAVRAAPVGSVYFLDKLEGDAEELKTLASTGLWDEETESLFPQRKPEGFNNAVVACWPDL